MSMKNLLPPRGVSAERRALLEHQLLLMVASNGRRRLNKVVPRSAAIGLTLAIGLGGVGTAAAVGLGLFGLGAIHHVGPKAYPTSNHLRFVIAPSSGPLGTVVTVRVTGCFDPKGDNHELSYNAVGSLNLTTMQMQAYPGAQSVIPARQAGGDLSGSFKINYAPIRVGQFTAQCGGSMAQRNFMVTGPLSRTK